MLAPVGGAAVRGAAAGGVAEVACGCFEWRGCNDRLVVWLNEIA
jgi:hypothetical protein